MIHFGQGNPDFDLSNTQDRFQRILQPSYTQGIHFGFYQIREGLEEFELIAKEGVYKPVSSWPSIYWTLLDIEINELKNWKRIIPRRIQDLWWSIPRKNTRLIVDPDSRVKDSQGKPRPTELLCAHGISVDLDKYRFENSEEYKKSHWRFWSSITVSTTFPDLKHLPRTSSSRLIYRELTLDDLEAYHSGRKQDKAMRKLGQDADPDIERTRIRFIGRFKGLHSGILMGIFLKEDTQEEKNKEGEMIGSFGVSLFPSGWPEIHYILKEEYKGKRYGSEFLETFIRH